MLVERLFEKLLRAFVRRGTLRVEAETGRVYIVGDGTPPEVHVRLQGSGATRALLIDPELTFGELYMDGRLVIERGTLPELFALLLKDSSGFGTGTTVELMSKLRARALRFARANVPSRARRNAHHHYDLSGELYDLFLDARRQYSCAYFELPGQSLEDAQRAKLRRVAAKLALEPGVSVLDIGSGWGGLATYLAEVAGAARVKGISLAEEQVSASRRSAGARGLAGRVSFALEDYRQTQGVFDRIVSVGMFEHVGPKNFDDFFAVAARSLADRGVMLLHTIGRTGAPGATNPWIRKYIFPGGHVPTLSEIMPAIERSGLVTTDIEVLRGHYAETLRHWRERFAANREEAARLYDERFCRMWEFYLACSEAVFRYEDLVVFQIQLAKRADTLPIRRDYIAEREDELRRLEEAEGRVLAAE